MEEAGPSNVNEESSTTEQPTEKPRGRRRTKTQVGTYRLLREHSTHAIFFVAAACTTCFYPGGKPS